MTFKQFDLDKRIIHAIKLAGYTTPTPIQSQSIPKILDGYDVMGLAQTGTGKTAAFTLPILQHLLKGPKQHYLHNLRLPNFLLISLLLSCIEYNDLDQLGY